MHSNKKKEWPTLSHEMNLRLVNSVSLLISRGKGNIFKCCIFKEQHVICIFSYDSSSKNENTVQDLQAINYLLSFFSPYRQQL